MYMEFRRSSSFVVVLLVIFVFAVFCQSTSKNCEAELTNEKIEFENEEVAFDEEIQVDIGEDMTVSNDTTNDSALEDSVDESGAPKEYKRVVKVKATAYCLCKKCCGKSENDPYYGVTASGLRIIPNTGMKVIAVDPKKFSLGSEVYVESLDGSEDYGNAIAADTGGAIKGNHIDLYMDSHAQALEWGVRYVNLYIL